MDDAPHNPATIPAPGSYHWTPKLQREFLEAFATNGSVKISAAKVCMSPAAVYQLKQRPEGAAFKLGCAAALLIARGRLVDELLDRAIWGHEETTELMREEGRSYAKRRRLDSRLDWPGFLSLFNIDAENADADGDQKSGMAAALALWLAARDNRANPLATLWRGTAIANEVAHFSADSDAEPERADEEEPTPEEQAAQMTIWRDDMTGELLTNFPPPEGFVGLEEGIFGDEDYERSLDPEEEIAWESARAEAFAPLRKAGEAARRAFFALPAAANDPEKEGGKARKSASS